MITGRFYYEPDMDLVKRIHKGARNYFEKVGEYPNMAHVGKKCLDEPMIVKTDDYSVYVVPDFRMAEDVAWIGVGKVEDGCIN